MSKAFINTKLMFICAIAICACIYGSHLGDGYFADDFLYMSWLNDGFGKLLRIVTIDSFYPKMIRPLPASFWVCSLLPFGDIFLHLLSILLHAISSFLIGWMILLRTDNRWAGYGFCALFATFPLFGEPILWISGNFDLWATFWGLLSFAVIIYRGEEDKNAQWLAPTLFFFGLLSKESIIILPLLLPLFFQWHKIRRIFTTYCIIAASYLCVRVLLFNGIGGYQDESGNVILLASSPVAIIRVLMLQIPYRIILPLKYAGTFKLPILLGSATLLGLFAFSLRAIFKPAIIARFFACFIITLLPVASMIRIEYDHLGSRLLYLPIAFVLLIIGMQKSNITSSSRILMAGLTIMWGTISIINALAWTAAKDERNMAIKVMRQEADRLPEGSTVLMDVHNTLNGAYVFNNGIAEAASYYKLRKHIQWEKGTTAAFDFSEKAVLGDNLFELGFTHDGIPIDFTNCAASIKNATIPPILSWDLPATRPDFIVVGTKGEFYQLVSPLTKVMLKPGYYCVQIILADSNIRAMHADLFWRTNPSIPFTGTNARRINIGPNQERHISIRLTEFIDNSDWIQFRIDLSNSISRSSIESIRIGYLPPNCIQYIRNDNILARP